MRATLFWYVFRDLLRIFLLTSGVLAGIMSFGGLLAPLTKQGLDVAQVGQMLGYLMPAMSAYSLPIAALFATTMVYGRLSADNELTAMRAAGISHIWMTFPAFVLGVIVTSISLLSLCFVVPSLTLRVERVIYSNLGKLVTSQIERNHSITFDAGGNGAPMTIFAEHAEVMPAPPERPADQIVSLTGPLIVMYDNTDKANRKPEDFYMAKLAIATLRQDVRDGEITFSATLTNGYRFPREFGGTKQPNVQVSIGSAEFQSAPIDSPVRENTKFMDIRRLYDFLYFPEKSRRIIASLRGFVRADQENLYLHILEASLDTPDGAVRIGGGRETYELIAPAAKIDVRGSRMTLLPGDPDTPGGDPKPLRFRQLGGGQTGLDVSARQVIIKARTDPRDPKMAVDLELIDVVFATGEGAPEGVAPRSSFPRSLTVAMPPDVQRLAQTRTAAYYVASEKRNTDAFRQLKRDAIRLHNSIVSELHARVSFSLSCTVLVMVGCTLGMMFKSGNFLSAFAVSVAPALLSIVLIVSGQHTCENIPFNIGDNFKDPLMIGTTLIWSGNAVVMVIAMGLLVKLQRE